MIGEATRLVLKVYALAWALSAIPGALPRATVQMAKMAFEAQRHQLSLAKFNRMLESGGGLRSKH